MNLFKVIILCFFLSGNAYGQYINNQYDSSQANAEFNISGRGKARVFRAMQETVGTGNVHFAIEQTPGVTRWGIGTYTVENGSDLFGSDFTIYAYKNSGVYQGRYVTIKRATGNVGIGVTDPGTYKLAVGGTLAARRVKVTQETWADFVFHPDYKLPALQELESYIKANKRLPEMPSATEVKNDGLDLGEMNKKLLQKVEELTLYIIQQQKETLEQKEAILQLKADLEQMKKQLH